MRIDFVDHAEHLGGFTLFGDENQHLESISRVIARGIDNGATAIGRSSNHAFADFLMPFRDNEKLNRLSSHAHHLIQHKRDHNQPHISIDHLFPAVQNHVTQRHDNHIHQQDDASQRDVSVFVDDRGHDVRPSRTAVIRQSETQSDAAKARPDDASHERFAPQNRRIGEDIAEERNESRHHQHTVDGFDAELQSEDAQRNGQQHHVHAEVGELHRRMRSPVDDGRKACHAARTDVIGQIESHPPQTVEHHSDANHHVVGEFSVNRFAVNVNHNAVR